MRKLGAFALALAGVLGTAGLAAAQTLDPAAPPPAPPAAPVDPAAAPPGAAAAPAPGTPAAPAPGTPAPAGAAAPAGATAAPAPGTAVAQPVPAPAPAPPAPPAEPTPVAPVAQQPPPPPPSAGPPPAQATFAWGSTAPGADVTTDEPKKAKPLIWRGTTFTWNQAATTTAVGVGRDNIGSEAEFYGWDFTFHPQVYVLDLPKDKIKLSADIGWDVELTNSDSTTDMRDTRFKDVAVGAGYSRAIWESSGADKGEYKTSGGVSGRLVFPTSQISRNSGRYLSTSLGLNLSQQIKLLGTKADGLNNVTIGAIGSWGHLFARSYQGTNEDLQRTRQNATGQTIFSDVLSTSSFAQNSLTGGLTLGLPLYGDLSLATAIRLTGRFKHQFPSNECEANTLTGCVQADRLDDATLYQPSTAFDIALGYPIFDVVDVTLGYANDTSWIGEDGQRRAIFYSPDAQFYLDLTANLDVIYSRATGREKKAQVAKGGEPLSGWY